MKFSCSQPTPAADADMGRALEYRGRSVTGVDSVTELCQLGGPKNNRGTEVGGEHRERMAPDPLPEE